MTSTQETIRPAPSLGQAVGQAEASLTRLLAGVLAESGTSRVTYLALQRLAALGGRTALDVYQRDLSGWLQLDPSAARELAAELVSAGLAATGDGTEDGAGDGAGDGAIGFTARGQALREEIAGAAATIIGPMLAALDRGDLEITIRTLQEITTRARQIPGRPATTEEN
jgi:hypothetical protein